MDVFLDPVAWTGFAILVALQIVLGIDNLVLVSALAEKAPVDSRPQARLLGMGLALCLRIALLCLFVWLLSFTAPLFSLGRLSLSLRDLLLLAGGVFLVFKATHGLHERLEGGYPVEDASPDKSGTAYIIAQIALLDVVFSLDSTVAALGLLDSLILMIAAVCAAMFITMLRSERLSGFILRHPTLRVLCLNYLLLIGLALGAGSLGFHIPKGYVYAVIGLSMLVEISKQLFTRRERMRLGQRSLRLRTADAVLRLIGGSTSFRKQNPGNPDLARSGLSAYDEGARDMLYGVLTMDERHIRSIMTPRPDIDWVDMDDSPAEIRETLRSSTHGTFPVRDSASDEILGVVSGKDLMSILPEDGPFSMSPIMREPVFVQESVGIRRLMEVLRATRTKMVLVTEEYGSVVGLVTPLDILEVIAGDFPEADEDPDFIPDGDNCWKVDGGTDIHRLELLLDTDGLRDADGDYVTLGGYLMHHLGRFPQPGDTLEADNICFEVLEATDRKVDTVRVVKRIGGDAG